MVETVSHNNVTCALIIGKDFHEPGIHFFTPAELQGTPGVA
jgi:hypothetical protein